MDAGDADIRDRLDQATVWARKIRETLQPLLDAHGDRVHFRAASGGVAMVGLLHDRAQRGKSGLRNLQQIVDGFEARFAEHCRPAKQGRPTGEKQLQSALIRDAYTHGRRMHALEQASAATADPVELVFVSDELSLPLPGKKKTVCDILALRIDGGRSTPVLLELKDNRALGRLIEQCGPNQAASGICKKTMCASAGRRSGSLATSPRAKRILSAWASGREATAQAPCHLRSQPPPGGHVMTSAS